MSLKWKFILWYVVLFAAILGVRVTFIPFSGFSAVGLGVYIGIFAIMFLLFVLLGSSILRRIRNNSKVLEKLSNGELDVSVDIGGNDELGAVTRLLASMVVKLREREVERVERESTLNKLKKELEDQQIALLNLLEDVTEEKEFEHRQSISLLETVGEGIVVVDDRGNVTYVNPAFERMVGVTQDELVGKDFAEAFRAYDLRDKPLAAKDLSSAAVLSQGGGESKLQIEKKDGTKVAVVINAAPIKVKDQFKGVVRVLHDFSDDLKLERQKDDFFSIASHELRTPLTVISGNLDMIASGMGDSKISPEDQESLKDTLEAADRLTRMVGDFLNVSRLDQGRLQINMSDVNVCSLVTDVIAELNPLAEKRGIKLVNGCSHGANWITLKADEDKLREVLINLIGNSLKFTKVGSVTVEDRVEGDFYEIRVIDTGMGIAQDMQGLLFKRFQQAMERTLSREAGGTGLGLYISREFVRRMGGDIWLVSSEVGKGTTFAFRLPLRPKLATDGSPGVSGRADTSEIIPVKNL